MVTALTVFRLAGWAGLAEKFELDFFQKPCIGSRVRFVQHLSTI